MITHSRNRQLIRRAIDALQLVADSYQAHTNIIAARVTTFGDHLSPGHLLRLGRTTDTLERVISELHALELHALLDHPPGVGSEGPPRPLPRPVRAVDRIAEPGLAVPAAGDGGPTAA